MVIYQLNISECTQNIKVPKKSFSIYKIDVEKKNLYVLHQETTMYSVHSKFIYFHQ